MNKKVLLFNVILLLVLTELFSFKILRSDNLMYKLFGNTTKMWLTLWQNKPEYRNDLYSSKYVFDKNLGWVLGSNLDGFFDNDSAYYNTDNNGIRTTKEISIHSDTSIIRIAVIGDSYTEGAEVANHQNWPFYLEEKLGSKYEVLNFGVGGYGHDQCLIRLKEDVLKFNPDIVLLGFVNPDISRNVVAFRDFAKPMFSLNEHKELILSDSIIMPIDYYKKNFVFKSIALLNLFINNSKEKNYLYQEDLAEKIIVSIRDECEKKETDFKLVFIPTPEELNNENFNRNDYTSFIKKISHQNNIELINTLKAFKEENLKTEGHWDAKGNHIIAKYISLNIKQN